MKYILKNGSSIVLEVEAEGGVEKLKHLIGTKINGEVISEIVPEKMSQGMRLASIGALLPKGEDPELWAKLIDTAWNHPMARSLMVSQIDAMMNLESVSGGNRMVPEAIADIAVNYVKNNLLTLSRIDGVSLFMVLSELGCMPGMTMPATTMQQILSSMGIEEYYVPTEEEIERGIAEIGKMKDLVETLLGDDDEDYDDNDDYDEYYSNEDCDCNGNCKNCRY